MGAYINLFIYSLFYLFDSIEKRNPITVSIFHSLGDETSMTTELLVFSYNIFEPLDGWMDEWTEFRDVT